ncbi:hypothetical protein HZH68_006516 [Vespula germanica]|uniref:Uncharacterized protein n=1 Tax=Vespula germanica TaxID=30212 RepID=A0A834KD19_VESGE|nr:hypothetical protein HZH68_006516 [Vespula germanica]
MQILTRICSYNAYTYTKDVATSTKRVSSHMHPTPLPSVPSREQHPWLHIQSFRIIKWELARARGLPSIVGTDAFAKRHVGRL